MKRTAPNANFYDYKYYSISHLKFHRQFCSELSPVTLRVTANVAPEDHRNTDLLKIAQGHRPRGDGKSAWCGCSRVPTPGRAPTGSLSRAHRESLVTTESWEDVTRSPLLRPRGYGLHRRFRGYPVLYD